MYRLSMIYIVKLIKADQGLQACRGWAAWFTTCRLSSVVICRASRHGGQRDRDFMKYRPAMQNYQTDKAD